MKLELMGRLPTPGQASPAFYRTSRGTYVLQGWKLDNVTKCLAEDYRPDREELIEVPEELLHLIVTQYRPTRE